jgi:hypothetical protein
MQAVKRMTERLTGLTSAPTNPPPQTECVTATNAEHVQAGRAYDRYFFAYALGSDQMLGLDNAWSRTTLKRTAPSYYVAGACP